MSVLSDVSCAIVAVFHAYFAYLEIVLWTTPKGRRIFGTTPEQAEASAVLAKNQGVYNLILSGGLWAGVLAGDPVGHAFKLYFLVGVIIVGVYGAWTVNKKILWVQAAPAIVALAPLLSA